VAPLEFKAIRNTFIGRGARRRYSKLA
jgi:hypothetical protein